MSQPTSALLLALLVGTAAAAQPSPPARAPQQRDVTLPATPDAPAPEVYVAPGVLTTLVFPTSLERASVVLEEQAAHFTFVDVGERILNLEPRGEWGPEQRLGLKVRLKDGTAVALVLTSHPTQVDARVNVRRARSVETLEAELAALRAGCTEGSPMGLVRANMLDVTGVLGRRVDAYTANASGLKVVGGVSYRAANWALVDVPVRNLSGQAPWTPLTARLVGPGGVTVKAVAVWMDRPHLAPGEEGRVLVQTEAPPWDAGTEVRLEIVDSSGSRTLSLPSVKL